MKKRKWSTVVLLALFFVGLSVLLYPALSDFWNSRTQSEAIVDYRAMLEARPKEDHSASFRQAEEYNRALGALGAPLLDYGQVAGYSTLLDMDGTGMMGYVTIPKIGVELPLYHGTSDAVLSAAVGHLEGTSLPTGGAGTHTVVSAHRGLANARLFTDLDRLEVGDTFTLTVLDRELTYQVDQIRIVEPNDAGELAIEAGKDRCTLLTCTPFGINTQRLLVRGSRIESQRHRAIYVTSEAYRVDPLVVTPMVALPMLAGLMLYVLFAPVKKGEDE